MQSMTLGPAPPSPFSEAAGPGSPDPAAGHAGPGHQPGGGRGRLRPTDATPPGPAGTRLPWGQRQDCRKLLTSNRNKPGGATMPEAVIVATARSPIGRAFK